MNQRRHAISILLFITWLKFVSSTIYTCAPSAPCGCSANSAVVTKIVGGEPASSQTWGWAASLRYSSTGSHFCGGSIISASHILTAAHCTTGLSSASAVRVYVGSIYLYTTGQVRGVSKIYIHPYYSPSTHVNDISILKLSSPIDLSQPGVDPVCLPNVSSNVLASAEYPPPGVNLVAIGWGVLAEGSNQVSSVLEQVTIQSVAASSSYCRNVHLNDVSSQFCAGVMPGGMKDTCQGDSGGPLLMFTSNNVWEQVGITSIGIGCARPFFPGIYTRVAAYQSWINVTMSSADQILTNAYTMLIPILLLIFV